MSDSLRNIPLSYSNTDSRASALRLIFTLKPEWREHQETVEFVRFTDGITNTLLKAVNKLPGLTQQQIDQHAILLRAYGKGSDVLIDREREAASHSLLASYGLAPSLLARFDNGLLYKFIEGTVTKPEDLRTPAVWRAVASRLGEWHAILPLAKELTEDSANTANAADDLHDELSDRKEDVSTKVGPNPEALTPGKPVPNVWTVIQKWIFALPSNTQPEKEQKEELQTELEWLVQELGDTPGINSQPFVFSHSDLLSGNVIIEPVEHTDQSATSPTPLKVNFIDYEYAAPAPAAFDIANHFAEWGGFDCDFEVLPTRSQRKDFLESYLLSYNHHLARTYSSKEFDELFAQVDLFRGVPGFYWGVWALIQAIISQIDFDYAAYAKVRLGEYRAWKAEFQGTRQAGSKMPLRERRWAQHE